MWVASNSAAKSTTRCGFDQMRWRSLTNNMPDTTEKCGIPTPQCLDSSWVGLGGLSFSNGPELGETSVGSRHLRWGCVETHEMSCNFAGMNIHSIHLSAIIYLGHGIERKVQLWCVRMQLEGCCTPTILNEN